MGRLGDRFNPLKKWAICQFAFRYPARDSRSCGAMLHNRAVEYEEGDVSRATQRNVARVPSWLKTFGALTATGVTAFLVIGGIVLVLVPDLLLQNWFPTLTDRERAKFLAPSANIVLFGLGGIIALVGVGLSLSRHRQELYAAERDRSRLVYDLQRERNRRDEVEAQRRIETERALRERFVTTVNLLSDESPVNRQAALFALGSLADDWDAFGAPHEVQVCIEVLTAYLRAPLRQGEVRTSPQEITVKQAGYSVISEHLRRAEHSWNQRSISLAGVHIDFSIELSDVRLSEDGFVSLRGARVLEGGSVSLRKLRVEAGQISFDHVTIEKGGNVSFYDATFENSALSFGDVHVVDGGFVSFHKVRVADGGMMHFNNLTIADRSRMSISSATVAEGGTVFFGGALVIGDFARIEEGGRVSFDRVTVEKGGRVSFANVTAVKGSFLSFRNVEAVDGGIEVTGDISLLGTVAGSEANPRAQ